jgi:proprotein convertase subtilisin/kexin type 5
MQVGNRCTCSQGTLINGTCTTQSPNCQGNATFNGSACNCNPGFFNLRGMCLPNPSNCPPNSVQSANGSCVCNIPGFVVAGNQCQPCPPNSFFNGATCICYMGTYSNITGSCQICFPPSNWNGTSCNCPGGQTYINNQCITCHSSCRTCSGPFANQCLSCSNPSSRLVGGVCSGNCPPSTFFRAETGSCEQCSGRCVNCLSFSQCTQCSLGF